MWSYSLIDHYFRNTKKGFLVQFFSWVYVRACRSTLIEKGLAPVTAEIAINSD